MVVALVMGLSKMLFLEKYMIRYVKLMEYILNLSSRSFPGNSNVLTQYVKYSTNHSHQFHSSHRKSILLYNEFPNSNPREQDRFLRNNFPI